MRLLIAAIGRMKAGPLRDLYDEYAARMTWPLALREVEIKKTLAVDERRRQEADLLRTTVPPGAKMVVLDERGAALSSEAFSRRLEGWRDDGVGDAVFLIGGADGIDQNLRVEADLVLSLGLMTWPHLLVRGMLAEQLYRAQQIMAGHPYHRA